ncbi:MAG: hypothetical protein AAGD14_15655 [Planctomycetota bacterium]
MDSLQRLLGEVRDAVYLVKGDRCVAYHNGRLPPGVEPSDEDAFDARMPPELALPATLPDDEVLTDRVFYRDALHHKYVVRRRIVPVGDRWAVLLMCEDQPEETTRLEYLGRLIVTVAHDVNNMLTAVTGNTDLLLQNLEDGSTERSWAETLRLASRQASRLAHRMLVFGHAGAARPRRVELNEQVGDLARLLRRLLPPGLPLYLEPAPSAVWMDVDPAHLDQAILMLSLGFSDILQPGGGVRLIVDPEPAVILEAQPLRDSRLRPSYQALDAARAYLDIRTPKPTRFVLTPPRTTPA